MPGIADVAAHAGVSSATVSRVMSGKTQVAEATRQRVLAAAKELGYEPSRAAQALASGKAATIGVVVGLASSPSATERIRGVASRLAATPYDLALYDISEPATGELVLAKLATPLRVGAVILISLRPTPTQIARFRERDIPIVAVDADVRDVDSVFVDDVAGGRLVGEALLVHGHRRVAFIGDIEGNPLGFTSSRDRRLGLEAVLREAGVGPPLVMRGSPGSEFAGQATRQLLALPEPPSAIFAASDVQALGVLEAAHEAGVRVPDDLSVVGFDDVLAARAVGLATVRQPLEESGSYGAKLALEALEYGPSGLRIELPLSLIERRSLAAREM